MKKLFFTALVAIVAVGGAFATNARILSTYKTTPSGPTTFVNCQDIPDATCSTQQPLYYTANGLPVPTAVTDLQSYIP